MTLEGLARLYQWSQTLIKQSRGIGLLQDVREMRARINDALKSLTAQCEPSEGPLVSVVIPTRNEAKRLPALLHSLKNQCYRNIEVIVADYMSTDGTPEVAKAYGARVLNLDKRGVGYATYSAVEESGGEVIIRTDADAIFPRDAMKKVIRNMLYSS